MIYLESSGSFKKTDTWLQKLLRGDSIFKSLERYGQKGVDALASVTPIDSGLTASSWTYEVSKKRGSYTLEWHNTNVVSGVPVAILIQYGHGTGTGGWVEGRDFINPVIRPLFDQIADDVWREVVK